VTPLHFLVGKKHIVLASTKGLSRVLLDFDSKGQIAVLTVVTPEVPWRVFADGSTSGKQPAFVAISFAHNTDR
jgi:hypothetical protein